MSPLIADIRAYVARATSLPLDQNKTEVRMYAASVTAIAGYFLIAEPIFVLLTVPQSPMFKVASAAPSVYCVAAAFSLCLMCLIPHLFALVFRPKSLNTQWPRKLAALASFGSAVAWVYMANLSLPLDLGGIELAYVLRAIGALSLAFNYAYSVNAQQGREILHAKSN